MVATVWEAPVIAEVGKAAVDLGVVVSGEEVGRSVVVSVGESVAEGLAREATVVEKGGANMAVVVGSVGKRVSEGLA